ncbi:MAG TPA: hypothetical protein VFW71_11785 [Actinomycetota bacterium]|nr:hypothetical protein [Actinomycetota bacterium]
MHGHLGDAPFDYLSFFQQVSLVPGDSRILVTEDRIVAIPHLEVDEDDARVRLAAYEGSRGQNPLIFNTTDASERIQQLDRGEIVATKTHALIDISGRIAIVEYNHRGAKAVDIADVVERSAQTLPAYASATFALTPVVDMRFLEAIELFERIQLARIRIVRPNLDWTDHYNRLTEIASDSDARTVAIEATAKRNASLSRNNGVIQLIKGVLGQRFAGVKSALLTGVKPGESSPTSVSLRDHTEHQRTPVKLTNEGHVEDEDIDDKLAEYLNERLAEAPAEEA